MSTLGHQIQQTESRYRRCRKQRENRAEHLDLLRRGRGGDWRQVDEPSRVLNRLISLDQQELAGDAMASLGARRADRAAPEGVVPEVPVLERILAENDLLGVTFLLKGALVSRAVGRVAIRRGSRVAGFGTGFLVSPRLLLTNNHVLPDAASAATSRIQFNFFETDPGRPTRPVEFRLRPDEFFRTDPGLDFSLVAVEPRAGDATLADRGWIPLIAGSGKAVVGERVNIIQHPGGQPQQVAVHQNEIVDVVDDFLHYSTDTERGSSGSPVFNDQWDLAALHHSGVPERNAQGSILLADGTVWDGGDADRERIAWVANEGVRISRIVAHLKRELAGQAALVRLFDAAFEPCDHDFENLRLARLLEEVSGGDGDRPALAGAPRLDGPQTGNGVATWVLPLTISVRLSGAAGPALRAGGGPGPIVNPADEPADEPGDGAVLSAGDGALQDALARVEDHEDEPYYDEDGDREARDGYYPEGLHNLEPDELYGSLARLVEQSHGTRLSYGEARLEHLYPWVDLRPDRQLASIYSGRGFTPEEAIRGDLETAAFHEAALRERLANEAALGPEAIEQLLEDLEAQAPFNCEHVVPQSWFAKAQPMKADLHHLFACEPDCNSFRGNIPYFQFPPRDETVREHCGRRESDRFEPAEGKGPVARATLYFLLRYPGLIGDEARELQAERLEVLLRWHGDFPVDDYERHRNAAIFAVQGNRNPLIDRPDWAERIDFRRGFGPLLG